MKAKESAAVSLPEVGVVPVTKKNLKQSLVVSSELVPFQQMDIYVTPAGEDLGKVATQIKKLLAGMKLPAGIRVDLRGTVQSMLESFRSFALGLSLSVVILYLILVAQFSSFIDPLLIMLAIPMGFIGVLVILPLTHTTLNVMSLMGVLMLVGIAASNSILIVEFTHRLERQGSRIEDAVVTACRVRLRPILMTSLATIIGLMPMALKLGTGSEQYAPLARAPSSAGWQSPSS